MVKIGDIKQGKELGRHDTAKWMWQACPDCGKERWVQLRQGKPKYILCHKCSAIKRGQIYFGKKAPLWKGGRFKRHGYWMVRLYPDDFFYPMADKAGYVREHRLIMAKQLERSLLAWEVVHHKNGVREDNRLENLELLPIHKAHLPDTAMRGYIKQLEKRIELLEAKLNKG